MCMLEVHVQEMLIHSIDCYESYYYYVGNGNLSLKSQVARARKQFTSTLTTSPHNIIVSTPLANIFQDETVWWITAASLCEHPLHHKYTAGSYSYGHSNSLLNAAKTASTKPHNLHKRQADVIRSLRTSTVQELEEPCAPIIQAEHALLEIK